MSIIVPQVPQQSVEPPRIQPAADETTFGGGPGLAAEGQQIQEVAGHANEIATFEKIRADQTAVQAASSQLDGIQAKLLTDPKEGLPAYQGINAITGHEKIVTEYQKQANDISRNLQPDQQGAFTRMATEGLKALNDHAMSYVNSQIEQHDRNTFESAITNKTQLAALNYGQPNTVNMMLNQTDKMAAARAARLGLDEDQTQDLMRQIHTNFHETVLSQMVNDPNFMKQAKAYFADHKNDMDAESQDRVRDLLDTVPKQREETAKQQQADYYKANLKQALEASWDGKMSLGEVQRLFRDGKLDKADYDTLASRYDKPDAQVMNSFVQSDPATFNAIRNAQLTGAKDPREVQHDIAQAFADKKISPDDGKYLMSMNSEKPPTPRDKYIDAAAATVRDSANRYLAESHFFGLVDNKKEASAEADNLVQQFYSSVDKSKAQTTKQIDDLRDHIIAQGAAKRYPGLGKLDKMPDVVIDIQGNVTRLLNPDQHSGLKPRYRITPTTETDTASKEK